MYCKIITNFKKKGHLSNQLTIKTVTFNQESKVSLINNALIAYKINEHMISETHSQLINMNTFVKTPA